MDWHPIGALALAVWAGGNAPDPAAAFRFPTPNHALLAPGGEDKFFVGTVGKPWTTGGFGCVRTEGWQMHEGLDIRCLERDRHGEAADVVGATASGQVAYVNTRAGLSNYGVYVVLRHEVEGLTIYSLYAHLAQVKEGLRTGQRVSAGEPIGLMGRTSNTHQGISKDRAHLHFELDFLVNERFAEWHRRINPGVRNDHGEFNGQNFLGIDPERVLLSSHRFATNFSLVRYLRLQPELCRVAVRVPHLAWAQQYPQLVVREGAPETGPVAGYELHLDFNGVPVRVIPRTSDQLPGTGKISLLSVNEAEYARNPCRRLVVKRGDRWELGRAGTRLLDLLTFR